VLPLDLGDSLARTVLDGPLLLAVPIAALAGLVSFASPCVLPLVPGYLGYVTGLSGVALERQRRGRMALGALLFVLGFTVVFLLIGFAVGGAAGWFLRWGDVVTRVAGVLVIVMGLAFLGAVPALQRERRLTVRPAAGLAGAPLLGMVFGLGWAPCIGPVFSAVLLLGLSGPGANAGRSALLALFYCLGLGLPFVLVALGFARGMRVMDVLRRHRVAIARFGGVLLVIVGLLLVTGLWTQLIDALRVPISGFETVI
jgi:cytochrome c-type biogenesis protein